MIDWTKVKGDMNNPYHYGITAAYGIMGWPRDNKKVYRVTLIDPNDSPRNLMILNENTHKCERYIGTIKELNASMTKYLGGVKCRKIEGIMNHLQEYATKKCKKGHELCVLIEVV